MTMRKLLVFLFVFSAFSFLFAEKASYRILNPSKKQVRYFVKNNYDIASYKPNTYLDLVLTKNELNSLKLKGYNLNLKTTSQMLKNNLKSSTRLNGYRDYATVKNELETIAAQHPGIAHYTTIGESWAKQHIGTSAYSNFNHDIMALKISDNPQSYEADEPSIFYFGMHHAREPISVEVCMAVLYEIINNYQTDPEIASWIANRQIWFVPIVNPDGHKIVTDEIDMWWRKNIKDNNQNNMFDTQDYYGYGADGVDLNRNYGYSFGLLGTSDDPNHVTYHGTNEFSELETQSIKNLIEQNNFAAGISYHSYGELVLYPWGQAEDAYAPDHTALKALSDDMAALIPGIDTQHYVSQISSGLYPTSGGLDDWAYGQHGVFCYTIELATEFIPPANQVDNICRNNVPAAKKLIERTMHSALKGFIRDANTLEPLKAEIYVEGIDNTGIWREPYTSSEQGYYFRMLPDGDYTVTIKSYGYQNQTQNITITNSQVTELNIDLVPASFQQTYIQFYLANGDFYTGAGQVTFTNMPLPNEYQIVNGLANLGEFPEGMHEIKVELDSYPAFETVFYNQNLNNNTGRIAILDDFVLNNFETEVTEPWEHTSTWQRVTTDAYEGNYCFTESPNGNYGNEEYYGFAGIIDLPVNNFAVLNCNLSFAAKYDLEENFDYAFVEFSTDGNVWERRAQFTGTSNWQRHSFVLNDFAGNNNQVYFRIMMQTDQAETADGIYIDDIRLHAIASYTDESDEVSPVNKIKLSAYPNPFNPTSNISLNLPSTQNISLDVYNIKGQKVKSIFSGKKPKGKHTFVWQGKNNNNQNVASGVYFYKLNAGKQSLTKKILLLK